MGNRSGETQAGPRDPHGRLAAEVGYLRRLVPVPHGQQPGRGRLRGWAWLHEPVPVAVRGVPALQDASVDPRIPRRRQARVVRCTRDHRGRAAVAAEDGVPGRRADRRRCGLPERIAHQGQPRGDQDRHAGRRRGVRCGAGRPPVGRAARLPGRVPAVVAVHRAVPRAQLQAVDGQGAVPRHADGRARAEGDGRQRAVDAAPQACGPRDAEARVAMHADRVSEAGRQADVRPAVVGVHLEHEPRREPAGALDAEGRERAGEREPAHLRGAGGTVLPGGGIRVREERRRQRPPRDQRAELRALQDLRHQGPDAEHRVGHAGRRRRAELSEHVMQFMVAPAGATEPE
ncbi:hypothetical protein BVI2075_110002 [Burkholderia vietnamiensis]|nr:hypothetical protein BVI2075_110002 [Burkholderia vietnamiensis]